MTTKQEIPTKLLCNSLQFLTTTIPTLVPMCVCVPMYLCVCVILLAGIKYNIIRSLVSAGIKLTVVPWNHDIKKERYDGLFISNGPGDPAMCEVTVENLRWALEQVFWIYTNT